MGWITSRHAIIATLQRGSGGTLYVSGTGQRNRELIDAARRNDAAVEVVTAGWLRSHAGDRARGAAFRSEGGNAAGSAPTVDLREWLDRNREEPTGVIVALDHVTDPHNLGAILRSSLLNGVALVVVPTRRSATGGDAVHRVSSGADRFVPVTYVTNMRNALDLCRGAGWWVYAADMGGTTLPSVNFSPRSVIVLGAEGRGISPVLGKATDVTVSIPGSAPPASGVDSFNVSVAAGILLYEYRRQYPVG